MTANPNPLPDTLAIEPLYKSPSVAVHVPGSKSITNRALVLAAMCSRGCEQLLDNVLDSEDTELMIRALRDLGFGVSQEPGVPEARVRVCNPGPFSRAIPAERADLFVGNSGTTMRFLTALVSLGPGRYRLDGVPRMRERPIEDLLVALRQLGVDAQSEAGNGCPPVVVQTAGWSGEQVCIHGGVSSQFLSGLLMTAPFAAQTLSIQVDGELVSEPYVRMTVDMMRQWGLRVDEASSRGFRVPAPQPVSLPFPGRSYRIEPDASAASYFLAAAAIAGGRVTVLDLPERSLQGDVRFADVLADMGCRVARCTAGVTVHGRPLRGIDVDMNGISDTVMTLAAVACFAEGPTSIRNVAHIRHKETDRLAALATELRKVGTQVEEFADGLRITPRPLHGAVIDTYNDHRMAMSMALVGLKVPGIVIRNPGCVAKTYPRFFEDLELLRG
jgi:3-phosphoshikimate 1-carboxyvinyltransferase